jgi:hypothetical protein
MKLHFRAYSSESEECSGKATEHVIFSVVACSESDSYPRHMDQNAGKNGYIQIGNKSFETVEQFKYLETTLTNQNYIHEEINSRLKSGNAFYHCMQNLLSSSLLT